MQIGDQADYRAVVDAIYDAALAPELWSDVLARVSEGIGCIGGVAYNIAPDRRAINDRWIGRLDPDLCMIYEQQHYVNDWAHYMMVQPAGKLVMSDEILPLSALRRTGFYGDVLHPLTIGHAAMVPLIARPDLTFAFTICSSAADGPIEAEHRIALERLVPHLCRAAQLNLRIDGFEAIREATLATIDRLPIGVVILDMRGSVLFSNRSALNSASGGALVLRDRAVTAVPAAVGLRLKRLIADVIAGGAGGALALPDPDEVALPLSVLVAPLRGRVEHEVAAGRLVGACAALFIRDPNQAAEPNARSLLDLFGLTPAEARVALALAHGDDLAAVAAELGVSVNTLKTHSRRIFGKMAVNRHAQFVRQFSERTLGLGPLPTAGADEG